VLRSDGDASQLKGEIATGRVSDSFVPTAPGCFLSMKRRLPRGSAERTREDDRKLGRGVRTRGRRTFESSKGP
jgi:hypothetical protein